MKATHIRWDVDDKEDLASLPEEIEIPMGMTDQDDISDYLSDTTGFCHKGYILEGCIIIRAEHKRSAMDQIKTLSTTVGRKMARLITEVEIHGLSVEDVAAIYEWMRQEIEMQQTE